MGEKTGGKKRAEGSEREMQRQSRRGLYVILLFLISGWMFYIGVLVGRGTSPVRFDIERLQEQIAAMKTAAMKGGPKDGKPEPENSEIRKELGFYESLKQDRDSGPDLIELKKEPPENQSLDEKNTETDLAQGPEESPRRTLSEKKPEAESDNKTGVEKNYSIQAASSKDLTEAEKLAAIYRANGFAAYTVSVEVGDSGIWHRVRIGPFDTFMEANEVLARVKRERPDALVLEHDPIPTQ